MKPNHADHNAIANSDGWFHSTPDAIGSAVGFIHSSCISSHSSSVVSLNLSLSFFFTVNATHDGHNFRLVESLQRNKRNRCQYSQRQETTQAYCRGNSRLVIVQRCSVTVSTTYWLLVFIRSLLLTTTFLQRQAIQE